MDNTFLVAMSRQVTLERQMDVVANNIANINTAGFKATSSVFGEFLNTVAQENDFPPPDAPVHFVIDHATYRNPGQGPIQQTGNPLDVAINGNGFLSVQTAAGERYTRNGAMVINAAGQLVTADGSIVNGENGPIVFQANDRNISISADGRIGVLEGLTNTETQRGKLRLVSFAQPQNLQSEGNNLFSATAEAGAAGRARRDAGPGRRRGLQRERRSRNDKDDRDQPHLFHDRFDDADTGRHKNDRSPRRRRGVTSIERV
jgi:flagellar basal body rod protein FlgG